MSFSRIGVLVSLFFLSILIVQRTSRADLVLSTLEAYAAEDVNQGKTMTMVRYSKEASTSSAKVDSRATVETKQANPFKLASYSRVEVDAGQDEPELDSSFRLVPEPSGIHLLIMTSLFLATRRRRIS